MAGDPAVPILARRVTQCWPRQQAGRRSFLWKVRYLLACRERPADRIGMMVDYLVMRWKNR